MSIKTKIFSVFLILPLTVLVIMSFNLKEIRGQESGGCPVGYTFINDQCLPNDQLETGGSTPFGNLDEFFGSSSGSGSRGGGSSSSILPSNYGLPTGSIRGIVGNLLVWILSILGIVGIIGFVISGIVYLLSAGNEKMIEKAKKAMIASILGVVVGLAGFVIIQAIEAALNESWYF